MVSEVFRQLLAEPRVPSPPRRRWHDWVLFAVLVVVGCVEVLVRDDLPGRLLPFVLGIPPMCVLLFRRSHPLQAVVIGFAAHLMSELVSSLGAEHSAMLYVSAWLLILAYALFRWGSGREAVLGMMVFLLSHVPSEASGIRTIADAAGATVFFLFPATLGAAVRYRASGRVRETEKIKLLEREQLARELHDTVAHHVSAIIIQAQAGRAVAATNPAAAQDVLATIEAEASRTLTEMRELVRTLRSDDATATALAPQRVVQDIVGLSRSSGDSPRVDVQLSGDLERLRPMVGAALYRLAQESVTNAIRHARNATRVAVNVAADDAFVHLTVTDDGDPLPHGASPAAGYGLIGMAERAKLLGGTLRAGPTGGRGWTTAASLPLVDVS